MAKVEKIDAVKRDGKSLTFVQTLFMSDRERKRLCEGKAGEALEKVMSEHKFEVELNFDGVTEDELVLQHASQTTFRKMWYNNVVRSAVVPDANGETEWDDERIVALATGEQPAFRVSVRELLDSRKSGRESDPTKDPVKSLKAWKAGKILLTDEQVAACKAEIQKTLDLLA